MTEQHDAYDALVDVVAHIKSDGHLDGSQKEQLGILHSALEQYRQPFHQEDVRVIYEALHRLARKRGGPAVYSHTAAKAFDREERLRGHR